MLVLSIALFGVGALIVAATVGSAVRTVVLPRGVPSLLTRYVFRVMRGIFRLRVGRHPTYERRDRIMALYAPLSLLILVLVWEAFVLLGYSLMFWAIGIRPLGDSFRVSGSSLLTLGTARVEGLPATFLMFSEAAFGLLLLALLITFLPSLYGAFSKREVLVAMLEVRASSGAELGAPPSALEMILRFWRIHGLDKLDELWPMWEVWFIELEETHTSFPVLAFFRSPQPEHSWITAAGAVLDAAALRASTIERPKDPASDLCLRAGYIALRRIADFFGIQHNPNPDATDPISIEREEYDQLVAKLAENGVPLKRDRDKAWHDFAGWRVNYDTVLVALAGFLEAPQAPWSSDRFEKMFRLKRTGGAPEPLRPMEARLTEKG
jgi:hypothetical protein